jgi:twitching motility protein PilT
MSQAFDWKQILNTEADPQAAAEKEGLAVNPVTGEPILDKAPLEVVEGGGETPAAEERSDEAAPTVDLGGESEESLTSAMETEELEKAAHAFQASSAPVDEDLGEGSMPKHYKPASLPDNIYDIPLTKNKFDVGVGEGEAGEELASIEDVLPVEDIHLDDILRCAIERKASDIHLTVGLPPIARIDGEVVPLPFSVLQAADTRRIVYDVLADENVQKFEQTHELDFGYGVSGLGRFRFNVYMQRGSVAGALRAIPTKIPSFEQLGLPGVIRDISKRSSGLVLVTGPTGSGKSTTIASMIDDINSQRNSHIVTIEDPIEYLHPHKKCMVNQRELHADTYSFHNALRAVLREDPDIILVGELRDLETIEAALTLAETGHLVFGTLHTRNAPSTIDRIIDVFPSDQQDQIRVLLGNTLEGVVSQQLLPRLGGGRCAAIEIMLGTPAVKNLIREGKTHQMYSVIETSTNVGMQTMDSALAVLFRQGYCSYEECLMRAVDKDTFARLAKGA